MALKRHLVITVHGIRTFGSWQERLESLLKAEDPTIEVLNYKYGYFSILAFMIPFLRWLVTRRFRVELLHHIDMRAWDRIDVVAHSFGTHLVAWGLYGIRAGQRPRINTLVLAGSVLNGSFPWRELVGASVGRVVNECGTHDWVLVLNQLVVLFTGMAGREGFSGMTGDEFRNRYFQLGHSGYFQVHGRPDDAFIIKNWLPLLLTEEKTPAYPDPRSGTPWRGLMTFLFNNAEPIKLFLWVAPLTVLVLWVNKQRVGAVQQAARARASSVLTIATSELGRRDPLFAALLMMELPQIVADLPEEEVPSGIGSVAQQLNARGLPERVLRLGHGDRGVIAISPGGSSILTANADATTWLWRTGDSEGPVELPALPVGLTTGVVAAAISPDGKQVVTLHYDGALRLRKASTPDTATELERAKPQFALGAHGVLVYKPQPSTLTHIAFSPDASRLVVTSTNGSVTVWRTDSARVSAVLQGHRGQVNYAEFSPDGTRIVTASTDGTARVWQADGKSQPVVLQGHKGSVGHATFSSDGTRIATASDDSTARLWWADGSGESVVIRGHSGPVRYVRFSPNGTRILTTSSDKMAALWSIDERGHATPIRVELHPDEVVQGAFSPDGTHVLTVSRDGGAILWSECGPASSLASPAYPVQQAVFSTDGQHVYTASSPEVLGTGVEGVVLVWQTSVVGRPLTFCGHDDAVMHAAYSPDGARFVTASADSTARVWLANGTGSALVLRGHRGPVTYAQFSPDGTRIVTTSGDSTARVWSLDGTSPVVVLRGHEGMVTYAEFSRDGRRLVTASTDGTARVWQVDGIGATTVFHAHQGGVLPGGVQHAAFSPDAKLVVTCGAMSAKVWSVEGPDKPIAVLGADQVVAVLGADTLRPILDCTFSPDSKRVATARVDGKVMIWRLTESGGSIRETVFEDHLGVVWRVLFSPDGKTLITASEDRTGRLRRLDQADGRSEPLVLHHDGQVRYAAFDSRGTHVVTASYDSTARVWDAQRGGEPVILRGHRGSVNSAVFSPDGNHVLTASSDGTAIVWLVDWRSLLVQLRNATTVCLSLDDRTRFLGASFRAARADSQECEQRRQASPQLPSPAGP